MHLQVREIQCEGTLKSFIKEKDIYLLTCRKCTTHKKEEASENSSTNLIMNTKVKFTYFLTCVCMSAGVMNVQKPECVIDQTNYYERDMQTSTNSTGVNFEWKLLISLMCFAISQ